MNFDNKTSRDPLDDLLQQARWPKAMGESRNRLEDEWRRLTRTESRRWALGWSVAAAATLVVAMGTAWVVMRPTATVVEVAIVPPTPAVHEEPRVIGRPVTQRELLLIRMDELRAAAPRRQDAAKSQSTPKVASPRELVNVARRASDVGQRRDALAELLESGESALPLYLAFVVDDTTRADALAAAHLAKSVSIDGLFAQLRSRRADLAVAAANVLGEIDGPVVTQRLIELIAADRNRREAFLALASSRGTEAQNFLKQAVGSAELSSWARSAIAQTEIR